jgi:hypothetical protein
MWIYEGEEFDPLQANGFEGFVYCITDDKGRKYIGKKSFSHRNKVKLSKKARVGTRKRVEIRYKSSGWENYWGSSKDLLAYIQEVGTEGFQRHILKLCENKQSLSYWEMAYMVKEEVLFSDNFWNGNVLGKFFRGKIHK